MRTIAELELGVEPDAELVASELVTNALLHGRPPVKARVKTNGTVRIEVEDGGRTAPIVLQRNPDAMTGRGLAMVAALTTSWGVEPAGPTSKTVRAEIGGAHRPPLSRPQVDIDELLASWSDDEGEGSLVTVRLGPVSTELLLAAKGHMDNVARELTLLRDGRAGHAVPVATAELIRSATLDFAEARTEIKRQASAAAAAGQLVTELELHLAPTVAAAGQHNLAALDEADRWARSAHLLTLAPPPVHRIFRQWYVRASSTPSKRPPPAVRSRPSGPSRWCSQIRCRSCRPRPTRPSDWPSCRRSPAS